MGNLVSDNQVCDCTCGQVGERKLDKNGIKATAKLAAAVVRTRSYSLGDNDNGAVSMVGSGSRSTSKKSEVMTLTSTSSGYNLRSKMKLEKKLASQQFFLLEKTDNGSMAMDLLKGLEKLSLSNEIENMEDRQKNMEATVEEDKLELPQHVLYYGWFFNESTSTLINRIVMHFFKVCYDSVPNFQRFMDNCCKSCDVKDPLDYYKRPGKRIKPDSPLEYHITAKFLGRLPNPPYQSMVQTYINKTFNLHLIGLVFTTRTLGVRVQLTPAQQLIFDEKEDSLSGRKRFEESPTMTPSSADVQRELDKELETFRIWQKLHKKQFPNCKRKLVNKGCGDGDNPQQEVIFKRISSDPVTCKSRAHITIGCAPSVAAKTTGDDLVDVVDLEQRLGGSGLDFKDFKLDRATLRQFGKHATAFVLYPDTEMIVPGQFNCFI